MTKGLRDILRGRVIALQVAKEVSFLVTGRHPKLKLRPACEVAGLFQWGTREQKVPAGIQLFV